MNLPRLLVRPLYGVSCLIFASCVSYTPGQGQENSGDGDGDGFLSAGGTPFGGPGSGGTGTGASAGLDTGGTGLGTGSSPSTGGHGGIEDGAFVEDDGIDCPVGELPASIAPSSKLPDPFTKLDGTRIERMSEWRCRRREIVREAEEYIYGKKPPKPDMVTGEVSNSSITVNVTHEGKSTSFSADVELPSSGEAPYPALISVGTGFFEFSHNSMVKGEGVAIIQYDPYEVGSESASRANKGGAFYDIYGSQSTTGLLGAWAWGVSRILDVIEQSGGDFLQVESVAVAGCSRFGKGAFAIGAFDQRIALTIPFESGSAGVPIWRGIPGEGAQSPSSAYGETYWLGDAFGSFTGSVNTLPIDTHEVIAMVAPRGLLVLDNPHIANLGPESAHVAALAGAEVYSALGAGENITYHSSVSSGSHCEARPEHVDPIKQNLKKHLFGTGSEPGVITAAGNATGNLASWRDWDTPTLD